MDSITKSKLSHGQILEMSKRAFGNHVEITAITELKDGYFNSAYMLDFAHGSKTVLKVSPSRNVRVMRYEADIMGVEVYVLNQIASLGTVPVPKVLYHGHCGEIVENEFFFMEYVEGVPLNKIYAELSEEQRSRISAELGGYVKQINGIEGNYFGYITQADKRFTSWSDAFLCMIKDLLEDARDAEVVLPYGCDELYAMLGQSRPALERVKKPSLVHKDLWQGNIFIDPQSTKITGLVDCERAVYADSLLEPVCGFLLNDQSFMQSYLGRLSLSEDEQVRAALYRIYLFLLMVIECPYRQYPSDDNEKWSRERLDIALADYISFLK